MTNIGGNVAANFRQAFQVVRKDALRWFPGHMSKGLKQMQKNIKNVDLIIEVHDARVPISGYCEKLKKTVCGVKPHITILNKMDLIDMKYKDSIVDHLHKKGVSNVVFTNLRDSGCKGMRQLLPLAKELILESNRHNRSEEESFSMMVIGVPNVGKSSLINRLRNEHLRLPNATKVGGVAGVTRSVLFRIKVSENPKVYLLDTPGILSPVVRDTESGLKLALVGCLQDHLVGYNTVADYLLFWLNKNGQFQYVQELGLPEPHDDILYVLTFIAAKFKRTQKIKNYDGQWLVKPDIRFAAEYFINSFRDGGLGKICLDIDKL